MKLIYPVLCGCILASMLLLASGIALTLVSPASVSTGAPTAAH